jgi:hypothetical protein
MSEDFSRLSACLSKRFFQIVVMMNWRASNNFVTLSAELDLPVELIFLEKFNLIAVSSKYLRPIVYPKLFNFRSMDNKLVEFFKLSDMICMKRKLSDDRDTSCLDLYKLRSYIKLAAFICFLIVPGDGKGDDCWELRLLTSSEKVVVARKPCVADRGSVDCGPSAGLYPVPGKMFLEVVDILNAYVSAMFALSARIPDC